MKKLLLTLICFCALTISAEPKHVQIVVLNKTIKGGTRTEVVAEPEAGYDRETNAVELSIEAVQTFEMRIIDIYGTVVYTRPVVIVDGTPTDYQLPELPVGIYTLKLESSEVSYEGILVIE